MADNDRQRKAMTNLIHALETRYAGEPDVYVSGNLFLYYREGDPGARVAPDVFVAFGVGKGERRSYRIWEEGRVPVLAFEIASQEGWQELLDKKKDLYERIGVDEYIVFDPDGEFIQPRLQGFRLEKGRYWPIPLESGGSLVSQTTGLRIQPEGTNLRLIDLATGERYPWAEEEREARMRAEQQAARESAARRAAEEELARLRAELERQRLG
ncbi:MAG TPA: Uma2 family endonuclease [Thermoanaerobaculia bacterium]|nr:Uma2 family endonuclease [Thermoanaerobaculia bacterium]